MKTEILKKMPCRLGTTSYIIPADILPNLRFLADRVDDVELVLFESDAYSNLPARADVSEMAAIARANALSYTVHLPLDAWPGSRDEEVRRTSLEKWFRVMDLMAPLNPFGWIVHLSDPPENQADLPAWQDQCRKSLGEMARRVDPSLLCVETLSYDYAWAWPMAKETKCAVCLDVGHLVLNAYDVEAYCQAWLPHARVLHVHGVDPSGRDHVALTHLDKGLLKDLLGKLKSETAGPRVMTLEIFSPEDLEASMEVLEGLLP